MVTCVKLKDFILLSAFISLILALMKSYRAVDDREWQKKA